MLEVASGPGVGLAGCKDALPPPPGGLPCWPFWGGGPGVGLALCCFVVYSTRRFVLCLALCHFVLVFFGPFCFAVASLGEGRANLGAFRTFVRFVLVWVCRFPLPLGDWKGLRLVIVALPGLFSIAITSLGEGRANLSAFRTFVRFVLVWICRFPFPLGVWEGLRFVIVALPGLFSYLCLAHRGSAVGYHLLWYTVEFAMSTRLCLLWWLVWFLCFRFGALAGLGAFVRAEFLCVSVLEVASGPGVGLAGCKGALGPPPPVVCPAGRSGAVVPVLVLLLVALWFILRGNLFYVLPCVILFMCFSVLFVLRLPRLGRGELIWVLFVRLFDLCLFGCVGFLFLLGSGKGFGL